MADGPPVAGVAREGVGALKGSVAVVQGSGIPSRVACTVARRLSKGQRVTIVPRQAPAAGQAKVSVRLAMKESPLLMAKDA